MVISLILLKKTQRLKVDVTCSESWGCLGQDFNHWLTLIPFCLTQNILLSWKKLLSFSGHFLEKKKHAKTYIEGICNTLYPLLHFHSLTQNWHQMSVHVFTKVVASYSAHFVICFDSKKGITKSNLYCCNWIFAIGNGLAQLYRRNNTHFRFSFIEPIYCNLRGLKFYLGMHYVQDLQLGCNPLGKKKANLRRSF